MVNCEIKLDSANLVLSLSDGSCDGRRPPGHLGPGAPSFFRQLSAVMMLQRRRIAHQRRDRRGGCRRGPARHQVVRRRWQQILPGLRQSHVPARRDHRSDDWRDDGVERWGDRGSTRRGGGSEAQQGSTLAAGSTVALRATPYPAASHPAATRPAAAHATRARLRKRSEPRGWQQLLLLLL